MARGEWADAEHSLKEALTQRPGGSVYSNLGALYIYAGRYSDAVPMLEQAVSLGGSDEKHAYLIWGNLGDAYRWSAGRETSAGAAYGKAIALGTSQLEVNPKDATLLSQIALYEAKVGELEQAQAGTRSALKLAPGDPAVLFTSALVLEMSGRRAASVQALRAALQAGYSLSFVEREPELLSLRKDPRYEEIALHTKGKK
jgi:tetratricopeptide (TPR) repeat protein